MSVFDTVYRIWILLSISEWKEITTCIHIHYPDFVSNARNKNIYFIYSQNPKVFFSSNRLNKIRNVHVLLGLLLLHLFTRETLNCEQTTILLLRVKQKKLFIRLRPQMLTIWPDTRRSTLCGRDTSGWTDLMFDDSWRMSYREQHHIHKLVSCVL